MTSTSFIQVPRLPIIRSQRGRHTHTHTHTPSSRSGSLAPKAQPGRLSRTPPTNLGTPVGAGPRTAHAQYRRVAPAPWRGLREAGDWYESWCVRGGRCPGRAWYYGGRGPEGAGGCAAAAARALGWGLTAPEQRITVSPRQLRGCRAGSEDAVPLRSPTFFFFFLNNRNQ